MSGWLRPRPRSEVRQTLAGVLSAPPTRRGQGRGAGAGPFPSAWSGGEGVARLGDVRRKGPPAVLIGDAVWRGSPRSLRCQRTKGTGCSPEGRRKLCRLFAQSLWSACGGRVPPISRIRSPAPPDLPAVSEGQRLLTGCDRFSSTRVLELSPVAASGADFSLETWLAFLWGFQNVYLER